MRNQSSMGTVDDEETMSSPALPRLFTDAAAYEKFLVDHGCQMSRSLLDGDVPPNIVQGFADLIAGDLGSPERAIAGRLAKLSVNGASWTDADLVAEPGQYGSDSDSEESSTPLTSVEEPKSLGSRPTLSTADSKVSSTIDSESYKLPPAEVVKLLCQEFGPLTAVGEEEKLLIEADGALLGDVVILGVIHLTTHRLTFHASLLSSRPDLSPSQQIIKAGPVTIHRKGFHKKMKMWLELSHDMLSSYASARDEDRIRPVRTVLYSEIQEVLPVDPKHPKRLKLRFRNTPDMSGYAELDTIESANDWSRELKGAIYLYRHRRTEFLANTDSEENDGVRISIPLNHIDRIDEADVFTFTYFLTVYLPLAEADVLHEDKKVPKQSKFQFATMKPEAEWKDILTHIGAAKKRKNVEDSSIVIDFGPLSCQEYEKANEHATSERGNDIRTALALDTVSDIWVVRARVHRLIASAGYFVVTPNFVGFWSKLYGSSDVRYRLPIAIVKSVAVVTSHLFHRNVLSLQLEGQNDLKFDFKTPKRRDHAVQLINAALENQFSTFLGILAKSEPATPFSNDQFVSSPTSSFSGDSKSSNEPRSPTRSATALLAPLSRTIQRAAAMTDVEDIRKTMPKAINLPTGLLYAKKSMHFMCLTIGSRGDVQPYIALGLGLKREGHRVTIVTHEEYKEWVVGFGIEHRTAGGDPGALMKLSVEHKMFSPEFFKESLTNFRKWLDDLLVDAWEQCQGADILLESPSAMAGVHIAEALNIPYFRCFTMPWTKTSSFPHAFLSPPVESPTFNSASYVLFDNVMWTATSGQINRWRRNTMKIGNTDMGHLAQSKITFIYNFSSSVVPKPLDWSDTTIISGYWFLDNPDIKWVPPKSLMDWMDKAKIEDKPIVYIGFGSIIVPDPHSVTDAIVKAVLKSGVRAIISKGWSARMSKTTDEPDVEMPPECYALDKVPHDWLFPQIDVAFHHGGAGTTGASLRAGIPTLIKPWFGDQYFWASRVQKLGAGLKVNNLRVNTIADALTKATTSRVMKEKAAAVGEKIRRENGVRNAIYAIYTYLDRASQDRTSLDKEN